MILGALPWAVEFMPLRSAGLNLEDCSESVGGIDRDTGERDVWGRHRSDSGLEESVRSNFRDGGIDVSVLRALRPTNRYETVLPGRANGAKTPQPGASPRDTPLHNQPALKGQNPTCPSLYLEFWST
jgi:hypothetical protein